MTDPSPTPSPAGSNAPADGRPSVGVAFPCFGAFADPVVVRDLLQAAEGLGYADVWFGDHVVVPQYAAHITPPDWLDPLVSCAMALAGTTTLRVGTDVLVAPYRHPLLVAKMAASIDHLSGGRLTLGVGVGYLRGEFEALGTPPYQARGAVTDEHLEVLRLLFGSAGPISHSGEHFGFEDMVFGPSPVQRPLPIWVGGNGRRALRRAARYGDGWHPLFPTPEQYAEARREIEDLRRDAGVAGRPFTFSMSCATTQVVDDGRGPWATNTWDEEMQLPEDFGYAPPVPVAADDRPRFVGTPDQLRGDLDAYAAGGVQHITLRFSAGGPDVPPDAMQAQMDRFSREVLIG
jgi:probable F420-dependent oxidoreductase